MKVCVVGGGGREHALAEVLARTATVVVSPGNPGIDGPGIEGSVDQAPEEIDADLFVIGPEAPLVDGLADRLRASGRRVFGPGADGAQLEGSKAWMKDLLVEAGVDTARHGTFTAETPALAFLDSLPPPYVIKTDGLAAGKGVVVTDSLTEARNAVGDYLSGSAFGSAGQRLVIEEGLVGPEVSLLAICDGTTAVPLLLAQDHKRLNDGDEGPNTGGMGAFAPVPGLGQSLVDDVMERSVLPTLHALGKRGIDYRGVLYAGLMLTASGPKMLEYNARFGDPESQVVLPLLETDLAELLMEATEGRLRTEPKFSADSMVTVVCASEGYPEAPRSGDVIAGLDDARAIDGVTVFAAGVAADPAGALITGGGRVLDVCGRGPSLEAARDLAYQGVARISWPGMQFRSDIAARTS